MLLAQGLHDVVVMRHHHFLYLPVDGIDLELNTVHLLLSLFLLEHQVGSAHMFVILG